MLAEKLAGSVVTVEALPLVIATTPAASTATEPVQLLYWNAGVEPTNVPSTLRSKFVPSIDIEALEPPLPHGAVHNSTHELLIYPSNLLPPELYLSIPAVAVPAAPALSK